MKKNYIIPETKTHKLRTVKVIAASPLGLRGTADGSEVLGRSYDFDDDDDYDY
jgi:hypothetical protein